MMRPAPFLHRIAALTATLLAGLAMDASTVQAAEQTLQNDTVNPNGLPVGDFQNGELAAVTLQTPCDGSIVAVQVVWASSPPGAVDTLEENIWIFDLATPTGFSKIPGPVLLQLEGPVLSPGFINEFRFTDEGGQVPIDVPVTAGQQFVVGLEFGVPTDIGNGSASVLRDLDTCQTGKNWLYGDVGGGFAQWINFCLLLSGDLAIRVVVDCFEAPGACCRADGSCDPNIDSADCGGPGETFNSGLTCQAANCPLPTGACCIGGGCQPPTEEAFCTGAGGVYAGDGTQCIDDVCIPGACCDPLGGCTEVIQALCSASSTFSGPGTTCTPNNPCAQPLGACCINEAFCFPPQLEDTCLDSMGIWAGPFTDCFINLCPICDDGDPNQDNHVDLIDYSFLQNLLGATGDGPAKCLDINNDNIVDLIDADLFAILIETGGPQ